MSASALLLEKASKVSKHRLLLLMLLLLWWWASTIINVFCRRYPIYLIKVLTSFHFESTSSLLHSCSASLSRKKILSFNLAALPHLKFNFYPVFFLFFALILLQQNIQQKPLYYVFYYYCFLIGLYYIIILLVYNQEFLES